MDHICNTVTLYTAQSEAVIAAMERDGVCFSRAEYVRKKYQESAPIFLTAYQWFVEEAAKLVPPPPGAEYPYWAFFDPASVECSGDVRVLKLEVPLDQCVFFDMYDWNKILSLRYLGENEGEEKAFRRDLADRGLRESEVALSRFYPQEKQMILDSWRRLFRYHEKVMTGDFTGPGSVQAGLWQLKSEWICP